MTAAEFTSIRESLGLTKAELARRLGVSWQQVWLIESDRVYIREVYQLALRGLQSEKKSIEPHFFPDIRFNRATTLLLQ